MLKVANVIFSRPALADASGGGSSSCDRADQSRSGRGGRGRWLGSDVGMVFWGGGGVALQVWCVVTVNTGTSQNLASFTVVTSTTFHFVPDFSGI